MSYKNTIWIEKFDAYPGIYIIFNMKSESVYIGKAGSLRRRMVQHVHNLFEGKDNNPKLQEEFNKGNREYRIGLLQLVDKSELDKYESIYYLAALELFGEKKVYNKQELNREINHLERESKEFIIAKENIKQAIERKNDMDGLSRYRDNVNQKVDVQDWIAKSGDDLQIEVNKYAQEIVGNSELEESIQEILIDNIKLRDLYESNQLDFVLLGKMGDYTKGEEDNQTFTDILIEKIADIGCFGKCLWATSGPNPIEFKRYRDNYNNIIEKKTYAVFSITASDYKESGNGSQGDALKKEPGYYVWKDPQDGKEYYCIAPKGRNKFKALVINKIWLAEEDFLRKDFYELYYQAAKVVDDKRTKRLELPISPNEAKRATLLKVFSKKAIWDSADIRNMLGLEGEVLERFKQEYPIPDFPVSSDREEHPIYYILAEIEDYVETKECTGVGSMMEQKYKSSHPYSKKRVY